MVIQKLYLRKKQKACQVGDCFVPRNDVV